MKSRFVVDGLTTRGLGDENVIRSVSILVLAARNTMNHDTSGLATVSTLYFHFKFADKLFG